ncbi:tyrosine-type recombinase/integrase [Cryomorpha ignava]|uniref:Tyrosine-type recombinase/integrase n=1 Tax=Cryomorpha ignava TaxID=101383 RepID=A0A7K3WW49_9FLAO|nr:tyrosine-type recombinase/integrase [Cryomorpha ignava]NEN25863.1 tyrosine-type recombinase/integrase [Cryomorpha ignava]
MRNFVITYPNHHTYRKQAELFYQDLLALGFAPRSARTKYHSLLDFFCRLEKQGIAETKAIKTEHLQSYFDHLKQRPNKVNGNPIKLQSCLNQIRAIGQFFDGLQQKAEILENPASALKLPRPVKNRQSTRQVLEQEEIKVIYEVAETKRERAMLALAYGCGLRVSELVAVDLKDIRFREKILIVPKGKGNKRRVVPLSRGTVEDISSYFYEHRPFFIDPSHPTPAFMLHDRGGRMKKYTWNKRFKALVERTENLDLQAKKPTMHHLRHSIATHLIEQGVKVEQVREFLGHAHIETTEIYTHIGRRQLKNMRR